MYDKNLEVLIPRQEIDQMVRRLADQITEDFQGEELFLICVLKGAFLFLADLVRYINLPVDVDFMSVSSYGDGVNSTGVVRIIKDLDSDISGKHVIIVEDIIDSGLTLNHLKELLSTRNPASISICAAFDKISRRLTDVKVDYNGIVIPDEFVVGYGLDYAGKYRNLPDVCILTNIGG